LSDKSSNLVTQNVDLAKKVAQLEKELVNYKNKEQDLLRLKDEELVREKVKLQQELEKTRLLESQRLRESQNFSNSPRK